MKHLFFYVFFIGGAYLMSGQQLSATLRKSKSSSIKKYTKNIKVIKEDNSNRKQTSLKRTTKVVRQEKERNDLPEW